MTIKRLPRNPLTILPLVLFVLLILGIGYLNMGSEGTPPTVTVTPPTPTALANLEATGTVLTVEAATDEAKQAAVARVAETTTAEANAAKTAESIQAATAQANKTATAVAAETATAETSALMAAEATETTIVAETVTAEANKTATAKVAPTSTPTSTKTPTTAPSPTATASPTGPPPEAIITAPTGVVLLRAGPGENYDSVATLPDGTILDVLRWVYNKENWLMVAVNPNTDDRIEGYIPVTSGAIKVNVDLNDIPPIYEFGPKLFEPKRFETRAVGDSIIFMWQDYGALEEHQYYSLIVVRDDLEDEESCYHWQTKETEMIIKPEDYDCTPGAYHWGVGLATDLLGGTGDKPDWRDDSALDERFPIGLGIPHPDRSRGQDPGSDPGHLPPDL